MPQATRHLATCKQIYDVAVLAVAGSSDFIAAQEKADQLASHRDGRDLRLLTITQVLVPFVQPLLRFPGGRDHEGRLSRLTRLELHTHFWSMPIAPRRLNEDMPAVTVARLGD